MNYQRIPLAAKIVATVFLAVLVPVYWHTYGPANFLWFCDAALVLTVAGMWLENSLLISACAVGILLPQCLWLADFVFQLIGLPLLGLTSYMFDHQLSIFTRGLSLFHGWLPLLLLWLLGRVGYDRRGGYVWTAIATCLVIVGYLYTPAAGVKLADANRPVNINYLYGFNDQQPQHWMNQNLYVVLWLGVLVCAVFLPTHVILGRIFAAPNCVGRLKIPIKFGPCA